MDISEVIGRINALNDRGVQLAMASPSDYERAYERAIVQHHLAADLAREHSINPDYLALSVANEGYARRRKGEEREIILGLLENILIGMPSSMASWVSGDSSRRDSYAGRARLLEEEALVRRYTPHAEIVPDLTEAFSQLEEAVSLYQQAVGNAPVEVLSPEKLESRLWRTYGIASAVATELARREPDKKAEYLLTASSYAQQELDARLRAGETEGFSLLNAYHTLGVAQSELAVGDQKKYESAKANLQQARQLAVQAGIGITISTLTFREAWLEYRKNKDDLPAISTLLQPVLDFQKMPTHRWDGGTKNALRPQMMELAAHLGGEHQKGIELLYSSS